MYFQETEFVVPGYSRDVTCMTTRISRHVHVRMHDMRQYIRGLNHEEQPGKLNLSTNPGKVFIRSEFNLFFNPVSQSTVWLPPEVRIDLIF